MPERHEDMQQIKHKLTNTKHNIVFDTINPFGKGKFEHLNAVLNKYNVNNFDWIIITDDDIDVPENFVDKFIFLADFFDLQISQPAHNFVSYATYSVTRRHWNSIARITNFVEIGPIFMLHRTVFSEILPFPEVGMGWGLDIYWSLLARERNWRMGIIDALPIRHLRPIGKSYDRHMALHEAEKLLKKYPMARREEILRTEKFFRNLRI